MRLTRKQRRVAKHIYSVGRRRRESRREQLAALATGLVEANLRNPRGGDRDSVGWRQERGHYGSVGRRRNVRGAAGRFFDETSRAGPGRYRTAGQLAQAVQKSAHPGRYDARMGEAKRILSWLERVYGKGGEGTRDTIRRSVIKGASNAPLRQELRREYLQRRNDPNALLQLGMGLREAQDAPDRTVYTRVPGKKVRPRVRDGGGYAGTEGVVRSATRGFAVGDRKRARKLTSSGNVSDHFIGNRTAYAHDLPARGAQGDRIFRAVARRLGVRARPGSYARHIVRIGGRRYSVQLLWKVEGHHDHVHVGVKRL